MSVALHLKVRGSDTVNWTKIKVKVEHRNLSHGSKQYHKQEKFDLCASLTPSQK